jgi:hypothetical protein
MKKGVILMALPLLLLAKSAAAIVVEYDVTSLGGDSFRFDYTVTNDGSLGAGVALGLFDILFDPGLYDESSLTIVTPGPPALDWDEIILASGVSVPAPCEAFALAGGIPDGDTASGFAVEFMGLGPAGTLPGDQDFEIFGSNTFAFLETGVSRSLLKRC